MFNLQSSKFGEAFLGTDGEGVKCQRTAGPWEQWKLSPVGGVGYYIQSVGMEGKCLAITGDGQVTMSDSVDNATVFRIVSCDPSNFELVTIQAPNGQFVCITKDLNQASATTTSKVKLACYSDESTYVLKPFRAA